jgi:hypothetical protein
MWGPSRIAPLDVLSLTVTDTTFDSRLHPLAATVAIELRAAMAAAESGIGGRLATTYAREQQPPREPGPGGHARGARDRRACVKRSSWPVAELAHPVASSKVGPVPFEMQGISRADAVAARIRAMRKPASSCPGSSHAIVLGTVPMQSVGPSPAVVRLLLVPGGSLLKADGGFRIDRSRRLRRPVSRWPSKCTVSA